MSGAAQRYAELIRPFLAGTISADEFQTRYFRAFKNETAALPEDEFRILDRLFGEVDNYVDNPALRNPGNLDEPGLRRACQAALAALAG